jgi:hypothetical protein
MQQRILRMHLQNCLLLWVQTACNWRRPTILVQRNIEARSRNHFYRGKAINITYSECLSVTLVIKHAKSLRRLILSFMACLGLPYLFPYCITNCTVFGKNKIIEHKMCWFSLQLLYAKFLILRRILRDTIISYKFT